MNTVLLLLACFSYTLTLVSGEPPITKNYQSQKRLRTPQKENSYVPSQPVDSPTSFGFVPVKTAENYVQKEPLGRYVYPDLLRQTQAYTGKYSQYQAQASYQPHVPQYSQQESVTGYSQPETQQVVQQYVNPQQYVQQYVHQPSQEFIYQPQQPQFYYQPDVKNVNYISDNHVPQYVYVQQVPEPSNTVENVVVPKDEGVRYIMLIPTYVPQQTEAQNYYVTKQTDQNFVTDTAPSPVQQQQYVYNTVESSRNFGYKTQPTSLLDSYIPSILQLQYYKKLKQAQNNEITDSTKALSQNPKKKRDA